MLFFLLAAGFFYPDLGATPLGRGMTGAAGAGDLSALALNPAGLATLHGLRVQAELAFSQQAIDYTRAGTCLDPRPCQTVSNSSGWFLNTLSGVSWALRPELVLAAGIYGPPSMGRENFPDPRQVQGSIVVGAPQRYMLISENNTVLYPGVAAAWRALEWLDVGAVVQVRYFRSRQVQSIYSVGLSGERPSEFDAIVSADATESARLVFGAGVIARPLPGLSLGLSARPGAPVHASGTLDVTLPSVAAQAGATTTGRNADFDLQLPPEARLGARYDRGRLSVLGEVTWQNWGVLRSIVVTPQDIVIHQNGTDQKVGPIEIPRKWKAAWSARAGAEFELLPWLTLRAGGLYETSAIPPETLQLDFVALSRFGATLGATARWRFLSGTVGYAHYFNQKSTVTGSQVMRIDPYPAPDFPVGNGDYSTSLDLLAFQLAATL
jgi:long-subunit fatty acid transport protein